MSSTPLESTNHFLFTAFPVWSHVRSFCTLAARLVREYNSVVVTIILSPDLLGKGQAEVDAELGSEVSESTRRRIRILATFQSKSTDIFSLFQPLAETYPAAYKTLFDGKSISCSVKGTLFDPVPAPRAVILDPLALAQIASTRAISGNNVPIFSWLVGHAATIIRLFGPEKYGGLDDIKAKTEAEAVRRGVSPEEIGDSIITHTEGKILKIPGAPEMYDWEAMPQPPPFKSNMTPILNMQYQGMRQTDGAFLVTAYAFEKESIEALKSWHSEINKEVFVVGPLLPSIGGAVSDTTRGSSETELFLQNAQAKYGEHSVIFISFGTIHWPQNHEYIEEVVEALIEKNIPFIFAYASPIAQLSEELKARLEASGLGLISKWLPQQYILNHPATGWFVTHCGQNSVLEALGGGTPMICWPAGADQPIAAQQIESVLKVGIELIEVRLGEEGMKPLLRNGRKAQGTRKAVGKEFRDVLDLCRSEEGEDLRKNVLAIKAQFSECWGPTGASRREYESFLKKYGVGF
ncbi:UDP-glycosyltransferase 84A1 [Psilocybe cubensis]|uniref:Glycosyltransferase family 1 protein n=2 Tax=Psilocybe cubensis TaxID=181762 RepID=A0A8H7XXF4_PSICU|nr:UDP-glycosyltransferase 84A1 [Psilocybe cubensis]KAH9476163.1 UDP-glycosyltransferase 84A1 [Psilocybe cubensis]